VTVDAVLLDAGALIDIERDPRGATFRRCLAAFETGARPLLPAVVFAQVWRGASSQHAVGRMRRICRLLPFTDGTADDVGRLLARSHTSDVVDAAVIVEAVKHNAAVVTSDPRDLAILTAAIGYPVPLLAV
jgi:predicted nucleic acid-binding protein